eukprot:Hpha_TRINITY_DN15241_c2_g15::TRINITY_DN15241_c2_g15_i1::g.66298::m.66298
MQLGKLIASFGIAGVALVFVVSMRGQGMDPPLPTALGGEGEDMAAPGAVLPLDQRSLVEARRIINSSVLHQCSSGAKPLSFRTHESVSCGFAMVRFGVEGRQAVLEQKVPLPRQTLWHCLYYACSHNTTYEGWFDCLQTADLSKPEEGRDSVKACLAAAGKEGGKRHTLGEIGVWGKELLASQQVDNPNPVSRPLYIPPDPSLLWGQRVIVGDIGSVVKVDPPHDRIALVGPPYDHYMENNPKPRFVRDNKEKFVKCFERGGEGCKVHKKVFVISQPLGRATFHFLVEGLPRLGSFLPALRADPEVKVHYMMSPLTTKFLGALGIPESQLVSGELLAEEVWVPRAGNAHDPFQALWGLRALSRVFPSPPVVFRGKPVVMLIQRLKNRFIDYREEVVRAVGAKIVSEFGDGVELRYFRDRDKLNVMQQVERWQGADIVAGLHGAGLSLMMFKPVGALDLISWRTGAASDIYEHMALALGHRFYHVLWRRSVPFLVEDVTAALRVALSGRPPSHPP